MSYCEMLETRFNRFIANANLSGAAKCVEDLFNLKPRIADNVAKLVYQNGLPLVDAVDRCVIASYGKVKL